MSKVSDSIRAQEAARAALQQEANNIESATQRAQAALIVQSTFLLSADIVDVYDVSYLLHSFGCHQALFEATIADQSFEVEFTGLTVQELDHIAHTVTLIPALNTKTNGIRFTTPSELAQFFDDVETGVYLRRLVRRERAGIALTLLTLIVASVCLATAVALSGAFWFLLLPVVAAGFTCNWIGRNLGRNSFAAGDSVLR
jgi:hypothetical protein